MKFFLSSFFSLGLSLFLFLGCGSDKKKLDVFSLDFEKETVNICPTTDDPLMVELFFKTKQREALILLIPRGTLQNREVEAKDAVPMAIPGTARLYYRSFDEAVTPAYFCDVLPADKPRIVKNIPASTGELLITVKEGKDDVNGRTFYTHTFALRNLILTDTANSQTVVADTLTFGTYRTEPPPPATP